MPFGTITKLGPLHSSRWIDGEYNDLSIYNYENFKPSSFNTSGFFFDYSFGGNEVTNIMNNSV